MHIHGLLYQVMVLTQPTTVIFRCHSGSSVFLLCHSYLTLSQRSYSASDIALSQWIFSVLTLSQRSYSANLSDITLYQRSSVVTAILLSQPQ